MSKLFTREELTNMDLETAKVELSNALYLASRIVEDLEYRRKIFGNGHHIRQQISKFGADLLEERWNE